MDINLEFGTAGIRAIIGKSPNQLNETTINFLAEKIGYYFYTKKKNSKVVIKRDNRFMSKEFMEFISKKFLSFGFEVFVKENFEMSTTPMISNFILKNNCDFGICITASHNTKEYNGIKVYGSDGMQILKESTEEIKKLFKKDTNVEVEKYGKIKWYKDDSDFNYIDKIIERLKIEKPLNTKILSSPLNGTAGKYLVYINKKISKGNVVLEDELEPDIYFKGNKHLNPEFKESFNGLLKSQDINKYDLIVAIDPDSDRISIMNYIKESNSWYKFNGNDLAIVLFNFMKSISQIDKEEGDYFLVTSNVSTRYFKHLKDSSININYTNVGFRWIGNEIIKQDNSSKLLIAFEESCGYLFFSDLTLEKCAFQTYIVLNLLVEKLRKENKTIYQYLKECWNESKLFYHFEKQISILIKNRDSSFIEKIKNYLKSWDVLEKSETEYWFKKNKSLIIVRKSGTEPKQKIYFLLYDNEAKFGNKILKDIKNLFAL